MKIDHIALFCKDLEQMRQFFIDYFEAVSDELYHNPRTGLWTYILTFPDGGARLELMQRPVTIDADPSKPNIGFIHVSFALGSKETVDEKTIELRDAGYKVVSGPRTTGDGYYESCILGPEGIQIEITTGEHSCCLSLSRKNIAAEKKRCNSHNCAQAILHTYADIAGISEEEAMNIAGAFGGGMGNMDGTCGALVGSGLVLGLVNKDKVKSMKQMRQIMTKFHERNGATQCKLQKGVGTKVVLRECPDCVADAAEFLEEQLNQD